MEVALDAKDSHRESRPLGLSTVMTRKQSFDAEPPTYVENVNVLNAVKLRHTSKTLTF